MAAFPSRLAKVGRATRGVETPKAPSPPPTLQGPTEQSVGEGAASHVHPRGLQGFEICSYSKHIPMKAVHTLCGSFRMYRKI